MDNHYKVVFRGDIAPGHAMVDVRASLQELFRLDDQGINKMFIGRPIAIKKNLDEATARKWCEILLKAGALAEYIADDSASPAEGPATGPAEEKADQSVYDMAVAPVGADVLKPDERSATVTQDIPTSHLSVDEIGADVLREAERTPFRERVLDLSHIHLED